MLIIALLKINRGLPSYNYYLDVADYLINETYLQLRGHESLWTIDQKVQKISKALSTATRLYKEESDPDNKIPVKKRGFFSKRSKIEMRFADLKICLTKKGLLKV